MKHWCCPDPNGEVSVESDFRVGGGYRIVMTVEGAQHIAYGTYREIDAPNRVVYTWDWDDPDMSMGETLVTVDFRANGEATDVTLVHAGFPALEAKEQHQQGWDACVARFEAMFG